MEFIEGNWYKNSTWKEHKYVKYLNHNNISVFYSERITTNNEYEYFSKSCDIRIATFEAATLEEIQPYLPEGHPDKKFVLPENWHINVTEENKEDVRKWSNIEVSTTDLCGIVKWFNPIRFETAYNTKGIVKEDGDYDFGQEITYNQFKKYVLNQPEENFSYLDKLLKKWNIK